jgi:hypothetical protein
MACVNPCNNSYIVIIVLYILLAIILGSAFGVVGCC